MAVKHRRSGDDRTTSKPKKNSNTPISDTGIKTDVKQEERQTPPSRAVVLVCAICCGLLHSYHVSSLFENDRHFSHLSDLEREMTFRTEMGLYYSYYKTLVEADNFVVGLNRLVVDNLTEYPDTINTLRRFNLYPEVVLGGGYRMFTHITTWLGLETKVCWQVNRGHDLLPVVSCEGLGDPMYFYLAGAWFSAALTVALLFLYGTQLSENLLGGFITVLCFFFNHGEATRIQWTPPLRESFAYPWSLALGFAVTIVLRRPLTSWIYPILLGTIVMIYLLLWQFAQFTVVTTLAIVYVMYTVELIPAKAMLVILLGTTFGFLNGVVLQFGNNLLLASPLAGCILGLLLLYVFLEPLIQHLPYPTNKGTQLAFLFISSAACKIELSQVFGVDHDTHILNILRSKLSNYTDFHTLLYTCSPEFDFLPMESLMKLCETLLIPCVTFIGGAVLVNFLSLMRQNLIQRMAQENQTSGPSVWSGVDPGVVFNVLQLAVFTVMALLIMRLKLFFTPQLCVMASLLASRKYWRIIKRKEMHFALMAVIVGGMCVRGFKNMSEQRAIVGEYANPELEELIEWVRAETSQDSVFAGPMPTMANLLLSTRRPIVNHPHYENAGLRKRTKDVYSIFSRRTAKSVHETLLNMKVNFVVLQESWCQRRNRPGCGMVDLWDVEEPSNRNKAPLCPKLFHRNPAPFQRVFGNDQYVVLQVPSRYVEIPPLRAHSA
ncbi:protein C-mannosyl-transferase DPY19L1 [Oratosquilla oratoria]|uniref:protein C-mannosyl-transferase DPY19L1 n=1 Tax=Oratosquilla oratoria TaxID=337810 RepID=UPI003F763728